MIVKSISKSEQIMEELKGKIKHSNFKLGDKFPSEEELAKEYGTTRITMNKVTSQLVAEGLLYRKHGAGTFFSDKKHLLLKIIVANMKNNSMPALYGAEIEILNGIFEAGNEKEFKVNFLPTYTIEGLNSIYEKIKDGRIVSDGYIFLNWYGMDSLIKKFEESNFNYVVADYIPGNSFNAIVKDRKGAIMKTMESLRKEGLTRIAYIGESDTEFDSIRLEAFKEGVELFGFPEHHIFTGFKKDEHSSDEEIRKQIQKTVRLNADKVDVIFVGRHTKYIQAVIDILHEIKRTDITIFIFENLDDSIKYNGRMIEIRTDYFKLGKDTVEFLEKRIKGEQVKSVYFSPEIVTHEKEKNTSRR